MKLITPLGFWSKILLQKATRFLPQRIWNSVSCLLFWYWQQLFLLRQAVLFSGPFALFLTGNQIEIWERMHLLHLQSCMKKWFLSWQPHWKIIYIQKKANVNMFGFNSQAEEGDQPYCFQLTWNVPCDLKWNAWLWTHANKGKAGGLCSCIGKEQLLLSQPFICYRGGNKRHPPSKGLEPVARLG